MDHENRTMTDDDTTSSVYKYSSRKFTGVLTSNILGYLADAIIINPT